MRNPCEFQDELGDILRKTEVSFVSLSCIVQTLWQCQVIIQVTVPIFVMEADKKQKNHVLVNEKRRCRDG